ncbi:extracellular solute-binding protein [Sphingomonas sp. 2R-10]|uniref:extracellular solute-binding protein n=1 Tax=Sphingomonas sp. 2R-10 TaxID=3045148 RepID=UPI000F76F6A0|nr:extracellular solute-binding protein [Sphingomonas sp. 2R-10]MDJ0275350.1 extracellular solute-binding protein [Sphingomonas sp. 2R-10]
MQGDGDHYGPTRRAVLGMVPAMALGACGRMAGPAPLRLWAMSYEGDYSPHLMPCFTAATGIPVDVQSLPTTASHEKLLTAHAGNALPDVLMLFNGWIREFAMIGAVAPVPTPALTAGIFPGIRQALRIGGVEYAVPWSVAPQVQYYRRDIVRDAGYAAPPLDWAGWLTMARAIKRRRPDDYVFLMLLNWPGALLTMMTQAGATMLRDRATRGNFRSDPVRHAFAFYAQLFAEGLAPRALSTEVQDPVAAFAQGYFAIWPSSPTTLLDLRRRAAEIPAERWGTARLAGPTGPGPVSGDSASLCVTTACERPQAAWALVRHMTSRASELKFQRMIGNLPARLDAWDSPQLAQPVLAAFREQMAQPAPIPPAVEWERIQGEVQLAAERVVRGLQTIDAALAALDDRVDRLLAQRRALVDAGTLA